MGEVSGQPRSIPAVSYTHLLEHDDAFGAVDDKGAAVGPHGAVSYTHLDVYKRQALVRVRAVRQHVAGLDLVAAAHDRTLVDAGSGIGTHELAQGIDVYLSLIHI